MSPMGEKLRHTSALLLLAALSSCQFDSAKSSISPTLNACTTKADCTAGSDCKQGLCVARTADAPLTIALQVTPQRSPDGSDPLPMVLDPFVVKGADTRSFSLPNRTTVSGTIRSDGVAIEAKVSFTPVAAVSGIPVAGVSAALTTGKAQGATDYSVQLLSGVKYRMAVLPVSTSLPPYHQTFTAGTDQPPSVDYTAVSARMQTFAISGAPSDRALLIQAFDLDKGEPVSSTAMVSPDGTATLVFGSAAVPFRLEIRAAQSYDTAASPSVNDGSGPCDGDTPVFPVFSVDAQALTPSTNGVTSIELPPAPQRIRYEGTVDLCNEQSSKADAVGNLPVSLHSRSLLLAGMTKLTASFDATTDASYDPNSHQLRFCVQVMPGDYDVVVTPPPSLDCALFAEDRLIQPPEGVVAASGTLLALPSTAYLKGTLQTTELAPLKGATIQATALGRSSSIELPTGDHSVTRYNRSQQTTTSADGAFKLSVDLGSYDVVIRPPAQSGFPWQVRHDVDIGARNVEFSTVIDMLSPVALEGTLNYAHRSAAATASLDAASVDAYAVIDDPDHGLRGILVGRATADASGQFTLLLPPATHRGW
jgi:hypothetical protein